MSRQDKNLKTKNNTMASNESMDRRESVPTKTSLSSNTKSYEYLNQNKNSKNNITESPYKTLNQQLNSRYTLNNKSSNSKYIIQNKSIQENTLANQGNNNLSGLKCTCNHSNQNLETNILKCTCPQNVENKCTCGRFKRQIFKEKNSLKDNYGYQLKNQQQITSKKIITYGSPNNQSLEISQEKNKNLSSAEKRKRIEGNICTFSKDMNIKGDKNVYNYGYYSSNSDNYSNERTNKFKNEEYKYSKRIDTNNVKNINPNSNRNYSYDNRISFRRNKIRNDVWNTKCVGQNNESLQILSIGKPELIAQCVQDMQVIQEPKHVQILLPLQPNEIDYSLGLEIYGKNNEEEKRALKEAERLRKQMEIQPLKNEELNISKEYSTIEPHFENLNIDRKEQVFCERKIEDKRQNKFTDINSQNQRKTFSVEHSEFGFLKEIKNKDRVLISIENHEINIPGEEKSFNKYNQKVLATKMDVKGIYKPNWNDLNKAIKTTKMNIDGEQEKPSEEPESEPEVIIKKVKKPKVKKPIKKKPLKKVVKKIIKKKEEEQEDEISESQNQELEIGNNYELELLESNRNFGPLKIQNRIFTYKGKEKIEEKPKKKKYEKNDVILDTKEIYTYEAEYRKNVNWNEDTIPMSGKPFTIDKKPLPTLSSTKAEKLSIKESYKTKDWNKSIKERNEIKINIPKRKVKRQTILKERIKPIIIKGKETNWNKSIQKENNSKLQIDKCVKKADFVLTKEKGVQIANETEEILINDDYNIVEENHSRPIRANIRKIEDYTEESVSSEYDILKNIHRHESQFNQFKELVSESIKINGQKVIINDISGKYPRKVEAFQGLEENFQKFVNDQSGQKKRFNTAIKVNITKSINKNIEQREINLKQSEENGAYGYYSKKKIEEKQHNIEPIQKKKVYQFKSKLSLDSQQQRKVAYVPEQVSKDSINRAEKEQEYYRNLERRRLTQDQEENEEEHEEQEDQEEQEEQESQQPEDKNQNPKNKIKYVYTNSMKDAENHSKMAGNHHHIEYIFEEEKSNRQIQEQEIEQDFNQGEEDIQQQEDQEFQKQMLNDNEQGNYLVKEEIQQQPDGQIRKIQYIYKEENLQPEIQTQQIKTKTHIQSEYQQYYYSPKNKKSQIKEEINQNKNNSQIQQKQEIRQFQEQEQQINKGNMGYNIKVSLTKSPKDKRSTKMENEKKDGENLNVNANVNLNQQENVENNIYKGKNKAYIKEITENEKFQEENKIKLRYITLKKREDQEETESQPQDEQPQEEKPKEKIQEKEIHEQVKIESQAQQEKENIQTEEGSTNKIETNEEIKQDNAGIQQNEENQRRLDKENVEKEELEKKDEVNNEEEEQENEKEQGHIYEEEEKEQQEEEYEQVEYDEENQQDNIEEGEQVETDEHIEGEDHLEEGNEQIEDGDEQIEVEEQEEQVEGDEEHLPEDENKNLPEVEHNMQNIQKSEEPEVVSGGAQHVVSSVEEITGQNINQVFIGIQNPQTEKNIALEKEVKISNLNLNINQENLASNQPKIRAQLIKTKINNVNYINQVNIQREELIRQSPIGIGSEQIKTSSQVISQDSQSDQNIVTNSQFTQSIRTNGSIKYDQNTKIMNPMMFSFGAKSTETEGQNITGSDIKNINNLENNDFLASSITNKNNNINVSSQQGGEVIEKKIIQTKIREVKDTSSNLGNVQYAQMQREGKQIHVNSPTQIRYKREPVDGDSKKKQGEEERNFEEENSFPLEPRDSKRNK